jgi:hypothetical protein
MAMTEINFNSNHKIDFFLLLPLILLLIFAIELDVAIEI